MGHVICPWSLLENTLYAISTSQDDQGSAEKKAFDFLMKHSHHRRFWFRVFQRNDMMRRILSVRDDIVGYGEGDAKTTVGESPFSRDVDFYSGKKGAQTSFDYIEQEKLKMAISVVNYLENENEALHEQLKKQTTEKL